MSALAQSLSRYGEYHRDRRNVATHLIGIPMIVLAVVVLLSNPLFAFSGFAVTPAMIASTLAVIWYLRFDIRFGIVMALLLVLLQLVGMELAALPTAQWLRWGIGLFLVGWIFQFIGHGFEGRKPAFLDDLKSLLVGPLFVVTELAFTLGLCKVLRAQVKQGAS